MADLPALTLPSLRLPAAPDSSPLDKLLAASGSAFMAVYDPHRAGRDVATLRDAIAGAERLLARASALGGTLAEAVERETPDAISRQLDAFTSAWPNASRGDLAGYGLHLVLDVAERQPCRYALRSALRELRQTSRFLPSIAEVLTALDTTQARVRDTVWHLEQLPVELDKARRALVSAEQRGAVGIGPQSEGSAR